MSITTNTTKTIVQLPLFEDKTALPTGKNHISFSEILVHKGCSYRHKLQYVEKLAVENDGSVHTVFGKSLHDAMEQFLLNGKMPSSSDVTSLFLKEFESLKISDDKREKETKLLSTFTECIPEIIDQASSFFDDTFVGWKTWSAEQAIFEKMDKQNSIYFKGFIDAVIRVPKKQKKLTKKQVLLNEVNPIEYEYWVIDFKTCSWGWSVDQKRDFDKHMQLALYKHYFSKITGIRLKDIKTAFLLMKRVAPKARREYDRLELVPISTGPITIEKALKASQDMVNIVRKGYVTKNRKSCLPFCPFYRTSACL